MKAIRYASVLILSVVLCLHAPGSVDFYVGGEFYGIGYGLPLAWRLGDTNSLSMHVFLLPAATNVVFYFSALLLLCKITKRLIYTIPRLIMAISISALLVSLAFSPQLFIDPILHLHWNIFSPNYKIIDIR
jgi:hypothetical protein